jgi:hypothetical protein
MDNSVAEKMVDPFAGWVTGQPASEAPKEAKPRNRKLSIIDGGKIEPRKAPEKKIESVEISQQDVFESMAGKVQTPPTVKPTKDSDWRRHLKGFLTCADSGGAIEGWICLCNAPLVFARCMK